MSLTETLKAEAASLGFSSLGIVPAEAGPHFQAYVRWLEAGYHGEMSYLSRPDRVSRRQSPQSILPHARSIIVVTAEYGHLDSQLLELTSPLRGRFAQYAWHPDYHPLLFQKLTILADLIKSQTDNSEVYRPYVDTGPILERSHAERAGLGFFGKNTMLIGPRRGSFSLLAEILTTAELEYNIQSNRSMPGCGSCSRCLNDCPTSAFPAPYVLDARKCISYLTIELKSGIPRELRSLMGNWVFGCDICQSVCPWQRFTDSSPLFSDVIGIDRAAPLLEDLLTLTPNLFASRYHNTAVVRTGRDRLVRNACVAAGNSKDRSFERSLISLLHDASPLVREHAAWALNQLGVARDSLAKAHTTETHPAVLAEINLALQQK